MTNIILHLKNKMWFLKFFLNYHFFEILFNENKSLELIIFLNGIVHKKILFLNYEVLKLFNNHVLTFLENQLSLGCSKIMTA